MTVEQQLRVASGALAALREPPGGRRFVTLAQQIDDVALQILRHVERLGAKFDHASGS